MVHNTIWYIKPQYDDDYKACSLNFLNPRYINSFAFGFVKVVLNIDRKSLWKSDRLVKKVSVS